MADRRGLIAGTIQLVFVIAVVGSALGLTRALKPDPQTRAGPALADARTVSVSTVLPSPRSFFPSIELNGVVQAQTRTPIAPQIGGEVIAVSPSFKAGSTVRAGDLLFRIDPADYRLSVERALAEVEAARSNLAQLQAEAELAVREWTELYPGQPISDLAAKRPQIAAAEARLLSAEAARKSAELSLSRTNVYAPFDARILATELDVGQVLAPSQSVGSAFAVSNVEVSAPISDEEMALVVPVLGRSATVRSLNGMADPLSAVVSRVDASLDPRTRLATLYLSGDDLMGFEVGRFLSVVLTGDPVEGALDLPASAFDSRDRVWVVVDDRLASRRVQVLEAGPDIVVVAPFDVAEGVVRIPPSNAREGLPVQATGRGDIARGGQANGAR